MNMRNQSLITHSSKINDAMALAVWAHSGQSRKDGTPFLLHPLAVCNVLIEAGIVDTEVLVTALVHDALEERPDLHGEFLRRIRQSLGIQVAEWVIWLTDDMRMSSIERKAAQLVKYTDAPLPVKLIKLSDRCANLVAPPPTWDHKKISQYAEHSHDLLAVLYGTHPSLESRLKAQLSAVPWSIAQPFSAGR